MLGRPGLRLDQSVLSEHCIGRCDAGAICLCVSFATSDVALEGREQSRRDTDARYSYNPNPPTRRPKHTGITPSSSS